MYKGLSQEEEETENYQVEVSLSVVKGGDRLRYQAEVSLSVVKGIPTGRDHSDCAGGNSIEGYCAVRGKTVI